MSIPLDAAQYFDDFMRSLDNIAISELSDLELDAAEFAIRQARTQANAELRVSTDTIGRGRAFGNTIKIEDEARGAPANMSVDTSDTMDVDKPAFKARGGNVQGAKEHLGAVHSGVSNGSGVGEMGS